MSPNVTTCHQCHHISPQVAPCVTKCHPPHPMSFNGQRTPFLFIYYQMSTHVTPCHTISPNVLTCHHMSTHVTQCNPMSPHATPCPQISPNVTPRCLLSHVLPCVILFHPNVTQCYLMYIISPNFNILHSVPPNVILCH